MVTRKFSLHTKVAQGRDILVKNESGKSVDACNETLKDIVSNLPPDKQILQTLSQFTNKFYEDNQLLSAR